MKNLNDDDESKTNNLVTQYYQQQQHRYRVAAVLDEYLNECNSGIAARWTLLAAGVGLRISSSQV